MLMVRIRRTGKSAWQGLGHLDYRRHSSAETNTSPKRVFIIGLSDSQNSIDPIRAMGFRREGEVSIPVGNKAWSLSKSSLGIQSVCASQRMGPQMLLL
jgi:hypothetical protein